MPKSFAEIKARLASIESDIEPIAAKLPADDLNQIADAIRSLVSCMDDLIDHAAAR